MKLIDNLHQLTQADQGSWLRLDGLAGRLADEKPVKSKCYKIVRVWLGGELNLKKYGIPLFVRPSFMPAGKMCQRAEVYTRDEFEELPEG